MLYQPTNIYPSMTGALGNGVIDANNSLPVSWQVNGNSPMTAYQITIYANNTASTQLFSTGKLTNGCPFYGVNYAGEPQFFSHTITAEQLSTARIVNGLDYKIVIQQWWNATDSVTQSSASVFQARTAPSVQIGAIPTPLATRSFTFSASYYQKENEPLNWARWEISSLENGEHSIIKDTGKIYGVSELLLPYDGFLTGRTYAVRLSIQTESGVDVTTGWEDFNVNYTVTPITGELSVCQANKAHGIAITAPQINNVPATNTEGVYVNGSNMVIPQIVSSEVTWKSKNGEPLSIKPPFDLLWDGDGYSAGDVLTISGTANSYGFQPSEAFTGGSVGGYGNEYWCCYGGGKYVAIFYDGTVRYSTDFVTWNSSKIQLADNTGWCGVAYGNNTYVAISYTTKCVAYSTDAVLWTVTTNVPSRFMSLIFAAGKFVAGGDGLIAYSTDGISWTTANAPVSSTEDVTAIAYGGGNPYASKYIASTTSGAIYYSTNGTEWVKGNDTLPFWTGSICFGATTVGGYREGFVAVFNRDDTIAVSADGVNWETKGIHAPGNLYSIHASWNQNDGFKIVAAGDGCVIYSSDLGETWTSLNNEPFADSSVYVFEGNGDAFVIAARTDGVYSTAMASQVAQPTDMVTNFSGDISIRTRTSVLPSEIQWKDCVYGDGIYVAVASYSETAQTTAFAATSGTLTEWTSSPLPSGYWKSISYGNGQFIAVGTSVEDSKPIAAYSPDKGTSWTVASIACENPNCIRFLNGNFYIAGNGIYRSPDGANWKKCTLEQYQNYPLMSLAYGNGTYVCVTTYESYYSYDGISWSKSQTYKDWWRCVVFGNGVFIAGGIGGATSYSKDGITWEETPGTRPGDISWNCLCYGANRFVALAGYFVYMSIDGSNWDFIQSIPVNGACCFGNGAFVFFGDDTTLSETYGRTANVFVRLNGGNVAKVPIDAPKKIRMSTYGERRVFSVATSVDGISTESIATAFSMPQFSEITSIKAGGTQSTNYIFLSDGHISFEQMETFNDDWSYHPSDLPSQFYADFTSDLNGDTYGGTVFSELYIYRSALGNGTLQRVAKISAEGGNRIVDIRAANGIPYTYYAFGVSDEETTDAIISRQITACIWDWAVISCKADSDGVFHAQKIFAFGKNFSSGDISNNNAPQILQNFTRYPTIQPPPFNYKSGTLTSLIGTISNGSYSDTLAGRDDIFELSTTSNTMFLKSRKGDFIKIRISGAIECTTMDNSPTQAQNIKLPWVEIGDVSDAQVICTMDDEAWPY